MPTDYRAMARARAASLAQSGVDISSVAAVQAARGTSAHTAAKAVTQGISREQLGDVLASTDNLRALATMANKYRSGYTTAWKRAASQAGPPVAAAWPLLKAGAALVGGYVADKGIDRITGGSTGGDSMNGSRYGGWTDFGVEGPGVFNPKDVTPTMYGTVTKQWVANGTLFQRNEDGTISVQRKDGTVKTYRPYKPIVFGKKTDAKKLARVAKKHRSIYKELHKMFGTKTRRAK